MKSQMKHLHEMIREFEPSKYKIIDSFRTQNMTRVICVDIEQFEKMREVAFMLADAIEDNKSASEQGFQVYPLEKSILQALKKARKLLGEK